MQALKIYLFFFFSFFFLAEYVNKFGISPSCCCCSFVVVVVVVVLLLLLLLPLSTPQTIACKQCM